jgi:hypothetical protein
LLHAGDGQVKPAQRGTRGDRRAPNLKSTQSTMYQALMSVLSNRFYALLFLTATAFQLGRNELLTIIDFFRFARAYEGREHVFDQRVDTGAIQQDQENLLAAIAQMQGGASHGPGAATGHRTEPRTFESPVLELVNRSGRQWPAGSDRSTQALAHATHSVTTARSRPSSDRIAADLPQASTSARSRSTRSCSIGPWRGALRSSISL